MTPSEPSGEPVSVSHERVTWVEGEPSRERFLLVWRLSSVVLSLIFGVLSFYFLLAQFVLIRLNTGLASLWNVTAGSVLFPLLTGVAPAIGSLYVERLPGRRPGFVRIGISSKGLAVRYLFWIKTYPWPDVRWADANHAEIRGAGESKRLALTDVQAAKVYRFYYPPLGSSRAR